MNTEKKLLLYSYYLKSNDGGLFRHNQIKELFEGQGFTVLVNDGLTTRLRQQIIISILSILNIVVSAPWYGKYFLWKSFRRSGFSSVLICALHYQLAKKSIKINNISLVAVEDILFGGQGALLAAKLEKIPVVVLPHNIDALTGLPKSIKKSCDILKDELSTLCMATHVFSIAERDTWVHQQFGVVSTALPYFPAKERLSYLNDIRLSRSKTKPSNQILIAGNAHNIPTREGMAILIEGLNNIILPEIIITVVGKNTDSLRGNYKNNFNFLGSVSDEAFADLTRECKAVLAYQTRGTGSLTRVIELLIAGIPVIGNPTAMRGWEFLNGSYVFESWEELGVILTRNLDFPSEIAPNDVKIKNICTEINNIVS